jgi:hypothetical protein
MAVISLIPLCDLCIWDELAELHFLSCRPCLTLLSLEEVMHPFCHMQESWRLMLRCHNDLLSAIALLAQAVDITDPRLQHLYISISDCQNVLQQLAQPVRTRAAMNASIAQELAANPLCSQMVRPHICPRPRCLLPGVHEHLGKHHCTQCLSMKFICDAYNN